MNHCINLLKEQFEVQPFIKNETSKISFMPNKTIFVAPEQRVTSNLIFVKSFIMQSIECTDFNKLMKPYGVLFETTKLVIIATKL